MFKQEREDTVGDAQRDPDAYQAKDYEGMAGTLLNAAHGASVSSLACQQDTLGAG